MSQDKQSWEKDFDDEVDRLVAKSLHDPNCKPLTELKSFISNLIATLNEDYQKLVLEAEKECRNRTIDEIKQIVLNNSTEGYTSSAKSFLVGNVDRIMFALQALKN